MYSTKEAAEKLGLSQDHVRLLARQGKIKARHLGHDWVVLNLDYRRKRKPKIQRISNLLLDQDCKAKLTGMRIEEGKPKKKTKDEEQNYETDILKILKQFQIFSGVNQVDLVKLANKATMLHFCKGEVLVREGEISVSFYLISKGMVRVTKINPSGKQVTIAMRYEGETFGVMPAIKGIPHFATTIALEGTDVLAIGREDFLAFWARNPSTGFRILELEVERVHHLYNRIVDIISESATQRITQVLIALCSRYGNNLHFTHQEIADMTGTTIETTTRILTRFKKAGIITLARGTIEIREPRKLCL